MYTNEDLLNAAKTILSKCAKENLLIFVDGELDNRIRAGAVMPMKFPKTEPTKCR